MFLKNYKLAAIASVCFVSHVAASPAYNAYNVPAAPAVSTALEVAMQDVAFYVQRTAENCLAAIGWNAALVPVKLLADYQGKLQQSQQKIFDKFSWGSFVQLSDIQSITQDVMRPFVENLRSIVLDVDVTLNREAGSFLESKGIRYALLSPSDRAEYDIRLRSAGEELRQLMYRDGRNYVRMQEIKKALENQLSSFVFRVGGNQDLYAPAGSSWLDSFANLFIETYIPASEVDVVVFEVAEEVLKSNYMSSTNLSPRASDSYTSGISRSITRIKNDLLRSGRNSIGRTEMKRIVGEELRGVIALS